LAKKYLSIKGRSALPLPARPTFKQNERTKEGVKFFEYWQDLSPELGEMARVRVYRMKPPIDLTKIGEKVKSIQVWEGPIPFKADDYEKEFYEASWAGGGDYRCAIEEIGLSGVVCEVFFSLSDWDRYPPKVPDAALMLESNGGKEYVAWRARRGDPVLNAEPEKTQEDDFMEVGGSGVKQGTATVLVEGLLNMADKQINVAQDDAKRAKDEVARLQSQPAGTNPAQNAVNGAIDLALQSAGKVVDSVMNHAGARYDPPDPIGMVTKIMDMMPKPVDQTPMILGLIQESNKTVLQMVLNQNQELKQEVLAMRTAQLAPATNGHTKSFDEELESFSRKAEALGYKRGEAGASAESKEDMVKMIVQNMPMINAAIAGIAQILIPIFRGPQSAPAAAPQPMQETAVVTQPAAPPQPDPNSPEARTLRFLHDLEGPFLAHLLSPEYNGYTLALHILTSGKGGSMETPDGRAQYAQIKTQLGKQSDGSIALDKLIRSYPPIWNRAQSNAPAYAKFLAEFLSYDEQPVQ